MGAENFAGKLKELREKAGVSQDELAIMTGLSKGGIADLEQGRRLPAWATVLAIADALKLPTDAFKSKAKARAKPGKGRPKKGGEG